MRRLVCFFILFILLEQCTAPLKKQKTYYIFDDGTVFTKYTNQTDSIDLIMFSTHKSHNQYVDTFLVGKVHKYYRLKHYKKYGNYHDSVFVKPKSFLNDIRYFDSEWLVKEENLDSFWLPASCWRCGGLYDTLQIYIVQPLDKTDSLIFNQVHRWYDRSK
ncbi:MAG TPA: hypothetical protein DCG69_05410 [Bacteroidales bacterium]|nr:hypothetical protein [Bacteroidales bacterium]